MSVEGLILHHGEAHGVTLHQTRIDYLVTAEHSKQCSVFEFSIATGFNTARTITPRSKRCSTCSRASSICAAANRPFAAGPVTFVFVPPGAAHAFGNSGTAPGRMLLIAAPPGHEKYFD